MSKKEISEMEMFEVKRIDESEGEEFFSPLSFYSLWYHLGKVIINAILAVRLVTQIAVMLNREKQFDSKWTMVSLYL